MKRKPSFSRLEETAKKNSASKKTNQRGPRAAPAPPPPCESTPYNPDTCYIWWKGLRCMEKCEKSAQHHRSEPCTSSGFHLQLAQATGSKFVTAHSCNHATEGNQAHPGRARIANSQYLKEAVCAGQGRSLSTLRLPPDAKVCEHFYQRAKEDFQAKEDLQNIVAAPRAMYGSPKAPGAAVRSSCQYCLEVSERAPSPGSPKLGLNKAGELAHFSDLQAGAPTKGTIMCKMCQGKLTRRLKAELTYLQFWPVI
jgi:hypothetical protein